MSISGISSGTSSYQTSQTNAAANVKKDFNSLGKAIKSGDIAAAKAAFTQLQKGAPAKTGRDSDPINSDTTSLDKALNSGDLKSAQEAYSAIQSKMSQGESAEGQPTGKNAGGGKPGDAAKDEDSSSTSSTAYDKRDTNEDGTVSLAEQLAYEFTHLEEDIANQNSTDSTSLSNSKKGGIINTTA